MENQIDHHASNHSPWNEISIREAFKKQQEYTKMIKLSEDQWDYFTQGDIIEKKEKIKELHQKEKEDLEREKSKEIKMSQKLLKKYKLSKENKLNSNATSASNLDL